ncbi:hypothetical protein FZO89_02980 [Luteimonas viscosa]|uniref:Uncharacterized protein n=1 Tax=Luteimonas viscosa TaxID=1132694 RepID=A0A5D4XMX8_9GAMM|nr:hypothetical protein [Luteimonas viscosa]TYT25315.1 hypothetical protein FZO89_02980 [Luteimonas viscosa]
MKIDIAISKEYGLLPPLIKSLAILPDDQKFFRERKRRHPFSLLTMAVRPYVSAMNSCYQQLEDVAKQSLLSGEVGGEYEELLASYQRVLHAAEAFDDVVNLLIGSFFSSENLASKSGALREFRSRSKRYRGKLGRTINAIKHRGGHLRPIVMLGSIGQEYCVAPGVYVEGVHVDGVIGPDEDVHLSGNSGFSLIRELRYYFAHIFFLCHWAEISLRGSGFIDREDGRSTQRAISEIDGIDDLARGLANSRLCMFPDEILRRNPGISFFKNRLESGLHVELRGEPRARCIMSGQIKSSFRGDSISRAYKLPYMGHEANEKMYAKLMAQKFRLD